MAVWFTNRIPGSKDASPFRMTDEKWKNPTRSTFGERVTVVCLLRKEMQWEC
jgi:hypothetical protein